MSTAPLRRIELTGSLGKKFGTEFEFHVLDGAEALRALSANLPGFREHLMQSEGNGIKYAVFYGDRNIDPEKELHDPIGSDVFKIVPVPAGSGSSFWQILAGAALIGISFAIGNPAVTSTMFQVKMATFGIGVGLVVGGVAQMISPKPKLRVPDSALGADNKTFSGAVNTTAQGGIVPIAIGKCLVGSVTMGGSISSSDGSSVGVASLGGQRFGMGFIPSASN